MATKEKRIEIRVSDEAKKIIEDAANLANLSLSSYMLSVVLKQARLDLARNEIISLNNKDRDALLKILKNPPEPNDALKDLFK